MNDVMGKCPPVIKEVPAHIYDILGNTTATSEGTAVKLSCYFGYRLSGNNVVKCLKGRWVPEVSACEKIEGLLQGQYGTTNPFQAPAFTPTAAAHSAEAVGQGSFVNSWGVTRDEMIIILSICLALAFLILVILMIVLAYYHRKRKRFWEDYKMKLAMMRMVYPRGGTRALVPMDKKHPPWPPHHAVPSIYTRPSGRPMYYPNYDYRWQHVPGRAQELGYPFLVYHPRRRNVLALEDNTQYTWNTVTTKAYQNRKQDDPKFTHGDGQASETESIEVVWDGDNIAWMEESEYTDPKIPRPSLTTDTPGASSSSRHWDKIPVMAAEGSHHLMEDHVY